MNLLVVRRFDARALLVRSDTPTLDGALRPLVADDVRAEGAVPVIAYVPASFEVVDEAWDLTLMTHGLKAEVWDRSLVSKRLREMSQESRSPFLDFTDDLRASAGRWGGEPYFRRDGHWNDLGNDIAAQTLVAFLRDNRLLPCSGPRNSTTPPN